MKFQKVKGTKDYYGIESRKFVEVKKIISTLVSNFAFSEVIMPTMESSDLFKRGLGNETDIVNKEMFVFNDKNNQELVLRPEGTASVARLVLENKLTELEQQQKLFYISNMFRYERPQKGRQREFYQLGVENLNSKSLVDDVEIIQLANEVLKKLEITKYRLEINWISSSETRDKYKEVLKQYYKNSKDKLSEDSIKRLETNVLRILDSKNPADIEVSKLAPTIIDYLSDEEIKIFEKIKSTLIQLKINFVENNKLVRGLDYYNDIVFEFISTDEENLGAKATLIGGGRYDTLITQLNSSKNVKAIGFAGGIERLILAATDKLNKLKSTIDYSVIAVSDEYIMETIKVASVLRKKYVVDIISSTQTLGKKISKAEKNNSANIVIVGEETTNNKVLIKNLETSKQKEVEIKKIGEI